MLLKSYNNSNIDKIYIYTVSTYKMCHWFFRCNFYKIYWRIFIIFLCTTSPKNAEVIGVRIFYHTFVVLLPYRVKCQTQKFTFHTILALCTCLYRSHLRKPVSMKQTNTAESQRLKIYMENVHHSREHMHLNDYATVQSLPRWWCGPEASTPSALSRRCNSSTSWIRERQTLSWSISQML